MAKLIEIWINVLRNVGTAIGRLRQEYWFGGLQNWKSGNCTLTTWNTGLGLLHSKRTLSNFPIIGRFTVYQLTRNHE